MTSCVALNEYGNTRGNTDQCYADSVDAHSHRIRNGMIQFFDVNRNLISAYPSSNTIINSVVEIPEEVKEKTHSNGGTTPKFVLD